jgi:Restriction Enzyme Adenine Methylase Associated
VTLQDIIAAGLLSPPLALFRKYRGTKLTAQLLPNGKVEYHGHTYDSCSTPAELARGTITGRRMNTNGWSFWQLTAADGKVATLLDLRQRFMAMKGLKPKIKE